MPAFHVADMTCGHCASTITRAVKAVDQDATVTVDLARHLVVVEPAATDAQALSDAIAGAGYTPVLTPEPARTPGAKPGRAGAGCGSGCGC
jgi:copper chaperone